jgi:hypothetical protein
MPEPSVEQFIRGALSIRGTLQTIEDALVSQGFDDYIFATELGTFRWLTVERAKAGARRQPWRLRVLDRRRRQRISLQQS